MKACSVLFYILMITVAHWAEAKQIYSCEVTNSEIPNITLGSTIIYELRDDLENISLSGNSALQIPSIDFFNKELSSTFNPAPMEESNISIWLEGNVFAQVRFYVGAGQLLNGIFYFSQGKKVVSVCK